MANSYTALYDHVVFSSKRILLAVCRPECYIRQRSVSTSRYAHSQDHAMFRRILSTAFLALAAGVGLSATAADETFKPLFNGKDLSGWVIVNVAPSTFSARDGMIVSTGKPTGTMRTERMYENFVM